MLKNKIQQSHLKDRIAFIKQFMNPAASYLVTRGALQSGGTKWKVVIGRKVGKGAVKNLLLDQNIIFWGKRQGFFLSCRLLLLSMGDGEDSCTGLPH